MKIKKHISVFLIAFFVAVIALPANINNYGAYIKIRNNMRVRIVGLDLINRSQGQVEMLGDSELRIDSAIVNLDGTFFMKDQTRIFISDSSFHNDDTLNIDLDAILKIGRDMVNSGHIFNAGTIDIGE